MTFEFKLPDIGEGLVEGEIVKWHVKEGDWVQENQALVNVLTDKAEVEIPSPKTGKVSKILYQPGQKVKVHETFVTIEVGGGSASPSAGPAKAQAAEHHSATPNGLQKGSPEKPAVSGGSLAMPAVRKLAQQMKVDITAIAGSGPGGRVTEEDVKRASGTVKPKALPTAPAKKTASAGHEDRQPFIGIRRRTADKMAQSQRTVATVTHMDEADFTALVALRAELKPEADKKGVKLTYLPFIIKALCESLKEYPNLNATLDEAAGVLVLKRYYNIGIATAAAQGLLVPVIKEADAKDVWQLAGEVNRLAERVRANKVDVSELQGGTFTITNIGPIGGLFATPIVNHPEVGILGLMKLQKRPVVRDGGIHIRDMINLVLSFDHRVLDGAEAAHFMNTLIKHLENPRTLL